MPLDILIVGSGVAGPAFASLLQRSFTTRKHNITLIERSPSLRLAGQQIDIKAQAIPVLQKMGLLETIKSHCVNETGLEMLDKNDKLIAQFGVTPAGKKGFTLTNEYEIMRGDVVRVLYEDSLAQRNKVEQEAQAKPEGLLTYEFSKTITALNQDTPKRTTVAFSNGETRTYDLVIGADGQQSLVRRLAFGPEASTAAFKSLGIHAAYYSVPRLPTEDGLARGYFTQSRFLLTRTSGRPLTGVYLFSTFEAAKLRESYKLPIEQQKEVWKHNLEGAGWQAPRFAKELDNTPDFYAHEQAQIKMTNLYKGRAVLLGDAGYGPSPFTGLGATLALVGAYVLAGELARCGNDVDKALGAYERVIRPYVDEAQQLPLGGLGVLLPQSKIGVWFLNSMFGLVKKLGVDRLMSRSMNDGVKEKGIQVPDYPELVTEKNE
ncbi:FAD/NAD(P)-binding domain-containing protein [Massarina eburnea CBS 473.64]|uniref:FAD/NAD(P)-binding domain-containing protein n=1 Tax=Massarina eburnea CBS 473.64 TaxID=1395130 RepID=A0A6A6S1L8_9PLEO|nr:FAD/NAD(P)-binding domain-containing protein [Massarina eburnea CBS 473.64]